MPEAGDTMSFLKLVKACDNFPYDAEEQEKYYKLFLPNDTRPHGLMTPESVNRMPWTDKFTIDHAKRAIHLQDTSHGEDVSAACNTAFSEVIETCVNDRIFARINGTHSEPFAILGAKYRVQIERYAAPVFGTVNRGAHLTAYVRTPTGMMIWVPRRSARVRTYPGMLDSTVAGGVRAGESPLENIVREAHEEASIPEDMVARRVRPVGALTMMCLTGEGSGGESGLVYGDVLYVFDMEVPEDFVLTPGDDEVEEFSLLTVDEVKDRLLKSEFKKNSAVVMIDFFIRNGIVTPDNEEDYVELVTRSHRKLPIPITPESD